MQDQFRWQKQISSFGFISGTRETKGPIGLSFSVPRPGTDDCVIGYSGWGGRPSAAFGRFQVGVVITGCFLNSFLFSFPSLSYCASIVRFCFYFSSRGGRCIAGFQLSAAALLIDAFIWLNNLSWLEPPLKFVTLAPA
jgi:hypothetical protein